MSKLWQLPVVGRLGVQHGLLVGWFLLVGGLAVMLLPGPAGSANAPGSLVEAQTVDFGGQSHCGVVVGIGASFGGSGSGDARCASVEAGGDAQVNTDGFGDIGMQFQQSPVGAAISNVHISNEGDNNSNNSIIGNSDLIINGNVGASANAFPPVESAAAVAPASAPVDPPVAALPVAEPAPPASAVDLGGQDHCGIVAGIGASGGGSGSGDTRCTSVEAGGDAQVNTDGFGDIGMQFQNSPVNAPITNVAHLERRQQQLEQHDRRRQQRDHQRQLRDHDQRLIPVGVPAPGAMSPASRRRRSAERQSRLAGTGVGGPAVSARAPSGRR